MNRRQLLGSGLASLLLTPRLAQAFGEASLVDVAELDLGRGTVRRPDAWRRLLYEVVLTTSVACGRSPVTVTPESEALFEHPFTVLVGDGRFEMPFDEGLEQLSRFLSYGGFLFIDEISGSEHSEFDRSVRELCDLLFPTRPLAPLPSSHSLYRSFFLVRKPMGRLDRFGHLEGVTVGNLTPVVYSRNDVSGALERGSDGRHRSVPVPGGEAQRREAVKLAINLVLYSLTANYKHDQAHVRELMKDNRLMRSDLE